ncbi:hypothetical protein Tco_1534038 [Tanacetum coccineum]
MLPEGVVKAASEDVSTLLKWDQQVVSGLVALRNFARILGDIDLHLLVAASKVPMLKPGIENGATLPKTQMVEGVMKVMPITTAEEKATRRLEVKARRSAELQEIKTMKRKAQEGAKEGPNYALMACSSSSSDLEFDEEERLTREKDETNIALTEEWDDIQAKVDADYQLAQDCKLKNKSTKEKKRRGNKPTKIDEEDMIYLPQEHGRLIIEHDSGRRLSKREENKA